MNEEMLEAILLDRSLGAVTPEVEALVEAYLEKDVAAKVRAQEWEMLAALARRSAASDEGVLPRLPSAPKATVS